MFKALLPLILLLCVIPKLSANNQTVTVYTEQMPPYNYVGLNNNVIGINADVVRLLFKRIKQPVNLELMPWPRAYKNTLTKVNSGLISTAYTSERAGLFKWVGPIASSKGYLYKLGNNTISLANLSDAKKYTVAAIRGGVYHQAFLRLGFEEGNNLILFTHAEDYLVPFIRGDIDLILGSDVVIPFLIKKHKISHLNIEPAIKMPDFSGNYLAFNVDTDPQLVETLNQALKEIKANGEFDDIVTYYRGNSRTTSYFSQK